jgi:hypothetical protein
MDGSRESKSNPLASDCSQQVSLHVPEVTAAALNPPPFDGTPIEQRVQLSGKVCILHWLAVPKKALTFPSAIQQAEASGWERMLLGRPFSSEAAFGALSAETETIADPEEYIQPSCQI